MHVQRQLMVPGSCAQHLDLACRLGSELCLAGVFRARQLTFGNPICFLFVRMLCTIKIGRLHTMEMGLLLADDALIGEPLSPEQGFDCFAP